MISSLFTFHIKHCKKNVLQWFLLLMVLGFAAVYLYTPSRRADFQILHQELPEVLQFLGILGESSLGVHIAGTVYGFATPLLFILMVVSSANMHISMPLSDGRMVSYLISGYRKASVLTTLEMVVFVEMLIVQVGHLLGQIIGTLVFSMEIQIHLLPLLRLNTGAYLVMLVYPAFACFVAVKANDPKVAGRAGRMVLLPTLFFSALARLPGWWTVFRFFTPITWLHPTQLLSGFSGWVYGWYALLLTVIVVFLTNFVFSKREL